MPPPPMAPPKIHNIHILPIFLFSDIKIIGIYLQKSFSFWGLRPPGPLPGLCPWTALGDFRPPDPLTSWPPYVNPEYATAYGLITQKQKKRRKIKIGINVPQMQSERSRSRSPDVKNLCNNLALCLLTGGGSSFGGSGADCKLGLTNHVSTRRRYLFLFGNSSCELGVVKNVAFCTGVTIMLTLEPFDHISQHKHKISPVSV